MMISKLQIIICLFTLSTNVINAQYIEQIQLPQYDCNISKWKSFESKKFIIVTPNNSDSLLNDRVKVHSSWYNDSCLIKRENELTNSDYENHLWILGTIADYENWSAFKLPVIKTVKGFVFHNVEFVDSLDGIGLVDTNRIAFIGNSSQTIFGLREPDLAYGYDFVITQKNKKTYFGNFKNDSVIWNNIEWLKEFNYRYYPYQNIDFFVSKKLTDSLNIDSINSLLQSYAIEFCNLFKIEIPKKKPLAFIHYNHYEIANMTAFWDGACSGHISGYHVWNEIHTEGYGFGLIKHEFGHHLFNENFKNHIPRIITEGVIEYYFNHLDSNRFVNNLELSKIYADSLNFSDFLTEEINLFGCGSYKGKGVGYGVSGVFVKYLIDSYGMKNFKLYCNQINHLSSINTIFNVTQNEFISDFKKWINSQKTNKL